jgi:hypothetical protein
LVTELTGARIKSFAASNPPPVIKAAATASGTLATA